MIKIQDFECRDAETATAVLSGIREYENEKQAIAGFCRGRGAVAARCYDGWANQAECYTQFPYAEFMDKFPETGDLICFTNASGNAPHFNGR